MVEYQFHESNGSTLVSLLPTVLAPDVNDLKIVGDHIVIQTYGSSIVRILAILRDHAQCEFQQLIDICAVDYPSKKQRFEVVYHLLSIKFNNRIRIKLTTDEETPIPSVAGLFPNANWYEREVWDLYGVLFSSHPDLRRILTDYEFDGHPLRKDFPLTGFEEVRYDEVTKSIVKEKINLQQAYRGFDFLSPWKGPLPDNLEDDGGKGE